MDLDLDRASLQSNDTTHRNDERTFRATVGTTVSFIVLLLAASGASAATLNVSGGQLLGASGVIVDGRSYNVQFLDGTCIALYHGCDDVSDFTFQTAVAAREASQALLDQVFLDGSFAFDSQPELTRGCELNFFKLCFILTPHGEGLGSSSWVHTVPAAINSNPAAPHATDGVHPGVPMFRHFPTSVGTPFHRLFAFAVWAPVPEPGTAVLIGLGLLGLSFRHRRES